MTCSNIAAAVLCVYVCVSPAEVVEGGGGSGRTLGGDLKTQPAIVAVAPSPPTAEGRGGGAEEVNRK